MRCVLHTSLMMCDSALWFWERLDQGRGLHPDVICLEEVTLA
jgi:hypothetical protein